MSTDETKPETEATNGSSFQVPPTNGGGQHKDYAADDDDDNNMKPEPEEEGAAEEDALFTNIETNEHDNDAAREQPSSVEAAPRLLQKAIQEGKVQEDEGDDEKKEDKPASPEKPAHQRVRRSL